MVVRWVLTDPVTADSYTFEMNPTEGGQAPYKKRLNYEFTTGPTGQTIFFEGRDETRVAQISGTILTEELFGALITWFQKRYPVQLTDDRGLTYMIYFTGFTATRKRSRYYPYKHDYSAEYIVLSGV